ncbi:retrotransposon protein, putative, ty1-copia subclass [Tanacetum coccineum]
MELERLGHVLPQELSVGLFLNGLTETSITRGRQLVNYMLCSLSKMTRKSFPYRPKRATDLLGIIHIDVCGPLRHVSKQGPSYLITFTDDYTRYGYVYLLKHKHEVFETFKVFKNEVENQLGKIIKALRSDRESATRILNMVPTKKVDKTPYELWYGKVSNLSYLKKNLITQEVSRRVIDLEEIQDEDTSPSEITSEISMEVEGFEPPQEEDILIRRSERTRRAPNRLSLNVEVEVHSLGDLNEPTSYKAAMLDSESNKWIDAMNAEIQSMMDNMVWVLVDLPPGCKTVGREATFILGIKIYKDRSRRLIGLGQNAYMDKILKRYRMDNSKRGHIPMQERLDLNKIQSASTHKEVKRMQNVPYTSVVGFFMYVVRCTRPDVAFAQNFTSRFQQNPAELRVDCYCNAGFEIDIDDMKSLTGYVSF